MHSTPYNNTPPRKKNSSDSCTFMPWTLSSIWYFHSLHHFFLSFSFASPEEAQDRNQMTRDTIPLFFVTYQPSHLKYIRCQICQSHLIHFALGTVHVAHIQALQVVKQSFKDSRSIFLSLYVPKASSLKLTLPQFWAVLRSRMLNTNWWVSVQPICFEPIPIWII